MELKRDGLIILHLSGKVKIAILKALQNLNVNKRFASRIIACYVFEINGSFIYCTYCIE